MTDPSAVLAAIKARCEGNVATEVRVQLEDLYVCTRHQSAWGYGTMGLDDFQPAWLDEDVVQNFVDVAHACTDLPLLADALQAVLDEFPHGDASTGDSWVRGYQAACNQVVRTITTALAPPRPRSKSDQQEPGRQDARGDCQVDQSTLPRVGHQR